MNFTQFLVLIGVGLLFIAGLVFLASTSNNQPTNTVNGVTSNNIIQNTSTTPKLEDQNEKLAIKIVQNEQVPKQLEEYINYTNDPGFIAKAKNEIINYILSVPGFDTIYEKNKDLIGNTTDSLLSVGVLKKVDYAVQKLGENQYEVTLILNGQASTTWYKVDTSNGKVLSRSEGVKLVLENINENTVLMHVRNYILNSMTDWLIKLGQSSQIPVLTSNITL